MYLIWQFRDSGKVGFSISQFKLEILQSLENRDFFSETVIENEQERIIRKNRIITKLERENEILRIKLEEKNNGTS